MVARSISQGAAIQLGQVAQDQNLLAEGFQRLHGGGKRKASSLLGREPAPLDDSIGSVDKSQTHGRISRCQASERSRGNHGIQQWKCESGAETAEYCTAW